MTELRRIEIEEMEQFEILDLVQRIRSVVWSGDDESDIIENIKELVGEDEELEEDE